MKDKIVIDLRRMMDEIFDAADSFSSTFQDSFTGGLKEDFYPVYSYPPTNVFMNRKKELVFEMALAGFEKKDLNLTFQGDDMLFSAKAPQGQEGEAGEEESRQYFKHRLKMKGIEEQKYYVPADRFERGETKAAYKNGLLRITIPPKQEVVEEEGINVDIEAEE